MAVDFHDILEDFSYKFRSLLGRFKDSPITDNNPIQDIIMDLFHICIHNSIGLHEYHQEINQSLFMAGVYKNTDLDESIFNDICNYLEEAEYVNPAVYSADLQYRDRVPYIAPISSDISSLCVWCSSSLRNAMMQGFINSYLGNQYFLKNKFIIENMSIHMVSRTTYGYVIFMIKAVDNHES